MDFLVEAANIFLKQRCCSSLGVNKTLGFFLNVGQSFFPYIMHTWYFSLYGWDHYMISLIVGEIFIRDKGSSNSVLWGRGGAWDDMEIKGLETGKTVALQWSFNIIACHIVWETNNILAKFSDCDNMFSMSDYTMTTVDLRLKKITMLCLHLNVSVSIIWICAEKEKHFVYVTLDLSSIH